MPKLQVDTQNESHYLRWSSNPADIKILKKSGKMQLKRRCRLVRFVCLRCIQQKQLNNFTKTKNFAIFRGEQERLPRPRGPRDYLRRKEEALPSQSQLNPIDSVFFSKLGFQECVREEKLRTTHRRKGINGRKVAPKEQFMAKEVPKKVKSGSSEQITDNEKILSKILNDFKMSEKGVHEVPAQLDLDPILSQPKPKKDLSILLPGKGELEVPFRECVRPLIESGTEKTFLGSRDPNIRKKIKLNLCGSINEQQRTIKRGMETQMKKWKKLFTKKQEIEHKLANHKKNSILASVRGGEGTNGKESHTKANAKQAQTTRKRQTSRSKILKMDHKKANKSESNVADPKREMFEMQLREERKVSNLIYNKSTKPLDLRLIRDRHERILGKVEIGPEKGDSGAPLRRENGHFNWDFMENEFYDQRFFNRDKLAKLDRNLVKKLHCEFLFMNEGQLRHKPYKNFLAEFLKKQTSNRIEPTTMKDTGNAQKTRLNRVEEAISEKRSQLTKTLYKFEENYLRKFKRLIATKVQESRKLLRKRIIFPKESLITLNENFPTSNSTHESLPLNYFEDIVASTEKCFVKLVHNVQFHRTRVVEDMSTRAREHFRWIDQRVLANRVIWTALRGYLRNHDVLQDSDFGVEDFARFLDELFGRVKGGKGEIVDDETWRRSCWRLCETVGYERALGFLREEQSLGLRQRKNFITYTDYFKKIKFLFTFEHYKINKGLLKDSSKLDETDCVLCFTAITCLSNPIIYCSKCERGAHRICLRLPSVPSEDFFCVCCIEDPKKKTRKKEHACQSRPTRRMWMDHGPAHGIQSYRFPAHMRTKRGEQLLVDRRLLLMKNRNSASRTEDINRVLSSKLDMRFDGKLCGMTDQWVHLEVPFRVVVAMVYALIKANFQAQKENEPGLELDLTRNQLRVKHKGAVRDNHILLDLDRNYNLEDWVYSSKYCNVAKAPSGETEPGNKGHSTKGGSMWVQTEADMSGESVRERNSALKNVIFNGMSSRIQAKSQTKSFRVFTCENMMILKKLLENDENFPKCIRGEEEYVRKISNEVGHEIGRVVRLFQECWFDTSLSQAMTFLVSANGQNPKKRTETPLSKLSGTDAIDKTRKLILNTKGDSHFEKPQMTKTGKFKHPNQKKTTNTGPKEFSIQDINVVRSICFEGRVTDDVRLYGALLLSNNRCSEYLEVELARKFQYEISAFIHAQELKEASMMRPSPKLADTIDINSDVFQHESPPKAKNKKKGANSRNGAKSETSNRDRLSKVDCCYFCGRSEFMLIEFETKKVHLICLTVSGRLVDFFGDPECKVSTLVILLKLVKYVLLNSLLQKDLSRLIDRLRHSRNSQNPESTRVPREVRQLFLQCPQLRREIIDIGSAIFKKNICDSRCGLCKRVSGKKSLIPDATKRGCLFRFLKGFSEILRRRIEQDLASKAEELPFYPSTLQQIISALKLLVELDSPFAEAFPEVARFQKNFLKKEFSLMHCRKCPEKFFHGICGYFNGNRLDLQTSNSESKFTNFLKKDASDFVIEGLCSECSRESYQSENSPRTMDQVEFLRRLPVNIDFIKKKMDFESFLEWKKQHTHHFTLE